MCVGGVVCEGEECGEVNCLQLVVVMGAHWPVIHSDVMRGCSKVSHQSGTVCL